MNQLDEFQFKIDDFLQKLLPRTQKRSYKEKIIHDAVWGTNKFYAWEVALIDSPLLQRLRRIHQTGLAYYIYPTATHTRFEHSLGVTLLVEKLIIHLKENAGSTIISDEERIDLRLAALLHDVGHSFFSHVSELVYDRFPEFQELKNEIINKYKVKPKGHEIFSFLIIRSKIFKQYFNELISCTDSDSNQNINKVNWDKIAGFIISFSEYKEKKYLADIINGPIDCDKLDYLTRDARFAGPVVAYDMDRYLYTINVVDIEGYKRLTVILPGVNVLEQIIISKMMMFSYVYHHHKVRAVEAMIKRLCFDIIQDKNNSKDPSLRLNHPTDFLNYTDENILTSFYSYYSNCPHVIKTLEAILNRELWIRAQLISCFNTNLDKIPIEILHLERDLHYEKNIRTLKNLKDKIIKEAKIINPMLDIKSRDIWIDVPFPPSTEEAKNIEIKKKANIDETIKLSDVFPLEQWIEAYLRSKWRAHIFCTRDYQQVIYEASTRVFEREFNYTTLTFTKDFCKIE